MGHGLLGCLPVVSIVGQGDDEERSPEDQVGHRDHYEHLHLDIFNKEITFSSHLRDQREWVFEVREVKSENKKLSLFFEKCKVKNKCFHSFSRSEK